MRVGELTLSEHTLLACNVNMGTNKDKLLLVLYSSKTHTVGMRPQNIKITANNQEEFYKHRHFCPFKVINDYIKLRGDYFTTKDPFFVFRDGSPVTAEQARKLLKTAIENIGLNPELYDMHSLRIGRATDLIEFKTVEEIQRMGRWKSNVVYKYIRQ